MKFALITGGSKGIGLEMATILAENGYNLCLIARSESELTAVSIDIEKKYSVNVHVLAIDLSTPNATNKVYNWYKSLGVTIEILINNAGFGTWGYFQATQWSETEKMLQTNLMALTELCYMFIPELAKNKQAYILNVSSGTAYQAVATMAAYAASKSFVLHFSRALAIELQHMPIYVTCLSPGATSTNFITRAHMEPIKNIADKVTMPAREVAIIGINAMFNRKTEVIPGFINKFQYVLTRILPKKLVETIAANLYMKYLH